MNYLATISGQNCSEIAKKDVNIEWLLVCLENKVKNNVHGNIGIVVVN